jgi:hypothetical protein
MRSVLEQEPSGRRGEFDSTAWSTATAVSEEEEVLEKWRSLRTGLDV